MWKLCFVLVRVALHCGGGRGGFVLLGHKLVRVLVYIAMNAWRFVLGGGGPCLC